MRFFARRHGLSPDAQAELSAIVEEVAAPETAVQDVVIQDVVIQDALGQQTVDQNAVVSGPAVARSPTPSTREGPPGRPSRDRPFTHVRYEDRGLLSLGGMGEVRRAFDHVLLRVIAVKLIRPELMERPSILTRFRREARITAQLQHPAIVAVHDHGVLDDGRHFFAMREVRGESFDDMIRRVHGQLAEKDHWGPDEQQALRRLVTVFQRVCEAVAYAHRCKVVHRDIKPSNVLVGEFGDVQVVDWGLAKVLDGLGEADDLEAEPRPTEIVTGAEGDATVEGMIVGTPAYMPPETAAGAPEVDPRGDVYSLGALLYTILSGRRPFDGGTGREVLERVRSSTPLPLVPAPRMANDTPAPSPRAHSLPPALVRLVEATMSRDPKGRPPNAGAVLERVELWLDGAERRARGMRLVREALERAPEAEALRSVAREFRTRARIALDEIEPWRAAREKVGPWDLEDHAARCDAEATDIEVATERMLHAALTHAPDLAEALEELALRYQARHAAAERDDNREETLRAEVQLRELADALPQNNERREEVARYLLGKGWLSLVTDPPAVRARLYRFETKGRRRVAVFQRDLGFTPVIRAPVAMGSYVVRVGSGEGRALDYPVRIDRTMHWDGTPPGAASLSTVELPITVGPNECWVPAGWFEVGGDDNAPGALSRRRLWADAFMIQRNPVTVRDYLAFLDALLLEGRIEEALEHVPREKGTRANDPSAAFRLFGPTFELSPDADGDLWDLDWPVMLVSWFDANAYAGWYAARTGEPWRLPSEYEWEKAARGVDGRFFPWGDHLDASWCCIRSSHPGRPTPARVDSYPEDVSVYGVRGLGGNVRDWCADAYRPEGPPTDGDRVLVPVDAQPSTSVGRVDRGGTWGNHERDARSAFRRWSDPSYRYYVLGFRLARSL